MEDKSMRDALGLASEAVDLLPDGMKEAASLAYQAVILNRMGKYSSSQERIRKLRTVSYTREPYCDILSAENEFAMAAGLLGDDPAGRRHIAKARAALTSYLSGDTHHRPAGEVFKARILKARSDYMLGYRKGIFMGIVDLPSDAEVSGGSMKGIRIRGLHAAGSTESAAVLTHADGGLFAASLEEPHLMVVAAVAEGMNVLECADYFIRLVHSVMKSFSSSAFYINGVMLSMQDVEEALSDISQEAFPVWFFARGSETEENGIYTLYAEGAESFGAKGISIEGVLPEEKEEAAAALSLILVYHVFSVSARRSTSFTISGRDYVRISSSRHSVAFEVRRES